MINPIVGNNDKLSSIQHEKKPTLKTQEVSKNTVQEEERKKELKTILMEFVKHLSSIRFEDTSEFTSFMEKSPKIYVCALFKFGDKRNSGYSIEMTNFITLKPHTIENASKIVEALFINQRPDIEEFYKHHDFLITEMFCSEKNNWKSGFNWSIKIQFSNKIDKRIADIGNKIMNDILEAKSDFYNQKTSSDTIFDLIKLACEIFTGK